MIVFALVPVAVFTAVSFLLLRDAMRNPQRWHRIFDEQRAFRVFAWIAALSLAGTLGAALAGGGALTLALPVLGFLLAFIPWRIWLSAHSSR